jgi:hypothetical protein
MEASDREAVTHAVTRIDERLRTDPENEGESRPDGRRISAEFPLGIVFRVARNRPVVYVRAVWLIRKRKN